MNGITFVIFMGILISISYYVFFMEKGMNIKIVYSCCLLLLLIIWIKKHNIRSREEFNHMPDIKKLVLLTSDSDTNKEWYISGMNSVLIGKQSDDACVVDVDLSDTIYSKYISDIHAVLNYSDGCWYVEDLNSKNGVGIKKHRDEYALRIKPLTPYILRAGDLLYIGKIKIWVQ